LRRLSFSGPLLLSLAPLFFLGGCAVALGPGYTIQKQNVELHFVASPEPHLSMHGTYELINSGNQPLQNIQVRVPGAEAFRHSAFVAQWNGKSIEAKTAEAAKATNLGDTIELGFNEPWAVKQKRTLTLDYDLFTGFHLGSYLAVSESTFFVFPESWAPELSPPKHFFGTGGVPPKKWTLLVRVPSGFLVHASGTSGKQKAIGNERLYSFLQQRGDSAPFAAGGNYVEKEVSANGQKVLFWTLKPVDADTAKRTADAVASRVHYYDAQYGTPTGGDHSIRLLECITATKDFGCGALPGTIFVQQAWIARGLNDQEFLDDIKFELGYTWFGGESRVRFDESPLPMDAVAPYAGWEAQANELGGNARAFRIQNLIADFDKHSADCKEKVALPLAAGEHSCSYSLAWTKSVLFFFSLEDKIGRGPFHKALKSVIQDRRDRDFALEDLISAMESETQETQGQFVRQWLKHSGIPDEFRARYSKVASSIANSEMNPVKEPHP